MRRSANPPEKVSSAQYKLLLQAKQAPHGRIYQADIGGGGPIASAWHRSCKVLVRRGYMTDVSSAGVYEITESGRRFIGDRVS